MILNTRYLASIKLKLDDDYIDNDKLKIVLIKKKNKLVNVFDLCMFFLFGQKYKHNIYYDESKNILIKTSKLMRYNIDGECLPLLREVEINRIKNALKIIVYK